MLKDSSEQISVSLHYDHLGRLLARSVNGKNRTQFIYDTTNRDQISFALIDGRIMSFTYDANGHLISVSVSGTKYYVACDHRGSPVAVFSTDGVLVKEITRTAWGKIIRDSNPTFWLPIDYHRSIRDPVLGVNIFNPSFNTENNEHQSRSGVYDPSIGQWLTPNMDFNRAERLQDFMHLYRFENNDPINGPEVARFDGQDGYLPMASVQDWLSAFGYNSEFIFGSSSDSSSINEDEPIQSLLCAEEGSLWNEFTSLSIMPQSRVKVDLISGPKLFLDRHEITVGTLPSSLSSVLITRSGSEVLIRSVESDKNPLINSVLTSVLNGTDMLPLHLVHHSRDEFFFIQRKDNTKADKDIEALKKLGSLLNVSRIPETESVSGNGARLMISSGSLMLNIRYSGESYDEELSRTTRIARRKAVQEAWQHESFFLRHGHPGLLKLDWTLDERKTILHSGTVRDYFGTDQQPLEYFPILADDPGNVHFKRDGSNILNRKRRNHSHRHSLSHHL